MQSGKPSLTGNQFSALVCLGMCIGLDALKRIIRRINLIGPVPSITVDFHKFIYEFNERGERVTDPFLVKLRDAERDLFLLPELVKKRGQK